MQGINVGQLKDAIQDLPDDMPALLHITPSRDLEYDRAIQRVPVEGAKLENIKTKLPKTPSDVVTVAHLKEATHDVDENTPVVSQVYWPMGVYPVSVYIRQVELEKQGEAETFALHHD